MKKIVSIFSFLMVLTSFGFGEYKLPKNFFILDGHVIFMQKSEIDSPDYAKGQSVDVNLSNSSLAFHHMTDDHTALRFELGHEWLDIDWKENRNFNQQNFHLIIGEIGFFTTRYSNWWILFMTGFAFDAKHIQFRHFSQWRTQFYARYNYQNKFRLHVGLLTYLGFRYNEVYPIIGIDFGWKKFHFNLVFPNDMSIEYRMSPTIVPFIKFRLMSQPRRLSDTEPRPLGAILYQAGGLEGGIRTVIKKHASIDIFAGYTGVIVNPKLRVEGRNGTNRIWYEIDPSWYFGLAVFVPF